MDLMASPGNLTAANPTSQTTSGMPVGAASGTTALPSPTTPNMAGSQSIASGTILPGIGVVSGAATGSPSSLPRQETVNERIQRRDQVPQDSLKKMIRDLNLKVTDQRLLILEALQGGRTHVTAQEVFEMVLSRDSSVGFATVYRFLRKLTESSYVTEVRMGGLPARYELTPRHHHDHMTCTHCGKICEFENNEIEMLQKKVADNLGFVLTHHVLELYGICPDCQRRESTIAGRRRN